MNGRTLYEVFRIYEGQPVKIFTDDKRVHCGIDLDTYEDAVRIIDHCGRLSLIMFPHIAAVEEPQMRLKCCHDECACREQEARRHDTDDH